jgi:phosphoribosylformylglycinamidine synthase
VLAAIRSGRVRSAHDVSDGGLAVALAECCITNREAMLGANVIIDSSVRADCLLFGESQSRVVLSCAKQHEAALLASISRTGVPVAVIGAVGGEALKIDGLIDVPLQPLAQAYYEALTRIMEEVG